MLAETREMTSGVMSSYSPPMVAGGRDKQFTMAGLMSSSQYQEGTARASQDKQISRGELEERRGQIDGYFAWDPTSREWY